MEFWEWSHDLVLHATVISHRGPISWWTCKGRKTKRPHTLCTCTSQSQDHPLSTHKQGQLSLVCVLKWDRSVCLIRRGSAISCMSVLRYGRSVHSVIKGSNQLCTIKHIDSFSFVREEDILYVNTRKHHVYLRIHWLSSTWAYMQLAARKYALNRKWRFNRKRVIITVGSSTKTKGEENPKEHSMKVLIIIYSFIVLASFATVSDQLLGL